MGFRSSSTARSACLKGASPKSLESHCRNRVTSTTGTGGTQDVSLGSHNNISEITLDIKLVGQFAANANTVSLASLGLGCSDCPPVVSTGTAFGCSWGNEIVVAELAKGGWGLSASPTFRIGKF